MDQNTKVCPECDSVIKGEICLNCGYVFDEANNVQGEKNDSEKKSSVDKLKKADKDIPTKGEKNSSDKPDPLVLNSTPQDDKSEPKEVETKKNSTDSKDDNSQKIAKPESKTDNQPETKSDTQFQDKSEPLVKPLTEEKRDAVSEDNSNKKNELTLETPADTKFETESEIKSETKSETKSDKNIEENPDPKSETKQDKSLDSKPETKLEVKADSETKTNDESGLDLKPETKPLQDTVENPESESKLESKAELKSETKEEPESEPKSVMTDDFLQTPNKDSESQNKAISGFGIFSTIKPKSDETSPTLDLSDNSESDLASAKKETALSDLQDNVNDAKDIALDKDQPIEIKTDQKENKISQTENVQNLNQLDLSDLNDNSQDPSQSVQEDKQDVQKEENPKPQVQSIFVDLAKSSGVDTPTETVKLKKHSVLVPVALILVLIVIGLMSYWKFIYYTPEFISPLVLSAGDTRTGDDANSALINNEVNTREKVLPFEMTEAEGNFSKNYFAQLTPPKVKLLVSAFDIKSIFQKYLDNSVYEDLKKEYDFDDDDVNVFLSEGFAIVYPEDDLKTWGFIIGVNEKGEAFVRQRLDKFEKNKESEKYKYNEYFAGYLTLDEQGKLESSAGKVLVMDNTESLKEEIGGLDEEESDNTDEDKTANNQSGDVKGEEDENTDATETFEGDFSQNTDTDSVEDSPTPTQPKTSYLIISNSKEFLDQMKESSEGNLGNLDGELKYAQARAELPNAGQVLIYKNLQTSPAWGNFVTKISPKLDYVGIDKILKEINALGLLSYTKDGKVRILTSE